MAEIKLKTGYIIGNHSKPYFIAEVNSSHNGNIDTAKEMCLKAKESGCNCVKFQSWSPETLYSKSYYDKNPIAKRIVQKFSITPKDLKDIALYCKSIDIDFSSTPYSNEEVDFLVEECNAPFIKIASMEINNYDFLRYIANKGIPMILSTGMADKEEVENAVKVIESAGNKQLIILHCISIYPAQPETINLKNITWLQEEFSNYPIGFSDHTLGTEISCGAIALGACVIEKHFTLDKSKMGMDNNMAVEPDEMTKLTNDCKNVFIALGTKKRVVLDIEYKQRENMRRSVVASRNLSKETVLTKKDLLLKRPGNGIPASKIDSVIGRKLLNDIQTDTLILETDLQ
mgnify:CR=1 FL=1